MRFAGSKAEAIAAVATDTFDPATEVIIVGEPGQDAPPSDVPFATEIESYETDRVNVRADFSDDGFLVVSTRYDPAWRAEVDGEAADVVRADGIFMAVPVEAGQHKVELKFEPTEYVWGRRISVLTLIVLVSGSIGYFAYPVVRRGKRRGSAP